MKKNIVESKKLVVAKETVRALDRRELVTAAGGQRRAWYTAGSGQEVCCA